MLTLHRSPWSKSQLGSLHVGAATLQGTLRDACEARKRRFGGAGRRGLCAQRGRRSQHIAATLGRSRTAGWALETKAGAGRFGLATAGSPP